MSSDSDGRQDSENVDDSPIDPMLDQLEGVIGEAIGKAVSQYRALLLQGLETEIKRIVNEFEVATTDVDQAVAKQTRSRLSELVEGEVRAVFDDTLGEAEQTLADPIWRTARDRHLPYLASKKSASDREASVSTAAPRANPTDSDRVSQPEQPEQPESEREKVEGPRSIAAPSPEFWVFPSDQQMRIRVQEEPDQDHSSTGGFTNAHRPPTDDGELYTDALSAVIDDNSDLETVIHDNSELVHVAHDPNQEKEPVDQFDPGPFSEIDDEELMAPESLDFDDLEEPDWDLPDGPPEMSGDWNAPDPFIPEEMETSESKVAESAKEAVHSLREEETAMYPADLLESHDPSANSDEEETLPASKQTAAEVASEVSARAVAGEDEEAEHQTEAAASVADEPALKKVDGPEEVVSDVEGDIVALAEQSMGLIADDPASADMKSGEQSEPANEGAVTFEGTVRLNVEAPGCVREIVQFVRELRQKPQLRLLRLVGNNREGVDIWLGLREPLKLGTILPEMEGVTIISKTLEHVGGPDERLLSVRLIRDEVPQNSGSFLPADSMPAENPKVVA